MSRTYRDIRRIKSWRIYKKYFEEGGVRSWFERPREYFQEMAQIGEDPPVWWGWRKYWRKLYSRKDRHNIKRSLRTNDYKLERYYRKKDRGDDGL